MTSATTAAAPAAGVSVPVGTTLVSVLTILNKLLDVVASTAFNAYVPAVARMFVSSTIITQAVDYGFGAVEGAVKGETLELPVASGVAQSALSFIQSIEPTFMAQIVGPAESLIVAELVKLKALPAGSSAASLGLTPKAI
jgi:hypothetical protein